MRIADVRDFRQRLLQQPVFGPFSKTGDAAFVEAVGLSGFDFIILDLEHGPNNTYHLQHHIRAAELVGLIPIVRVKDAPRSLIGEVLDIGAGGVQIPQITTADEAQEAVTAARFAPGGERGVCRFVRAAGFSSMAAQRYFELSNEALVIVQLEGRRALENVESIVKVSGIDVVFVGPYDLSQSLGRPGEIDHPVVIQAVQEIVQACQGNEVTVGTFVDSPAQAGRWLDAGVRYLSYSVDLGIFVDACRGVVEMLRDRSGAALGQGR